MNTMTYELLSAPQVESWRKCEFCGCRTNAHVRICCPRGVSADKRSWNPAALERELPLSDSSHQ